ncbi:inositol monophosphatase [[Leptolyngbya] sp. PCC 7376]|uniref:inositol monophosphatase family protein n=1 Tax=[Leptolyngbya] sp. PCC 7376 TaxID=111781 RepID=UPI00029EE9EE|nr:inositol monophosphatase family protein [[Leptolyngbya] sp. PCC 7376]AFY39560.1 inositol monophosphatase [[Leptolyngbya] sp. PCC 7376]
MTPNYSSEHYRNCIRQALDLADELATQAIATEHQYFKKGIRDFALDTDHNIERQLQTLLTKLTPDIPVLGEESFIKDATLPPNFWIIDPIDGTVNFSRQLPLFGITIALIVNSQAIAAGISFPNLRERYEAIKDHGATLNGSPLKISQTHNIKDAIIGLGDFSTGKQAIVKHKLTHNLLQHYAGHCLRIRMLGSAALQLAWLAAGRLDLSITLSNKPWDVQAGKLLVSEAGGRVFDYDGSTHNLNSRFTLGSNTHLSPQLIDALQRFAVNQ